MAGKNPCVTHDNLKSKYGIGKPLKFYIKNISFGLVTIKKLIFGKSERAYV